jgi:hypothetical protein
LPLLAFMLFVPATQAAAGTPTVLVVGDSLSAGYGMSEQESWVSLLRDRLAAEGYGYAVINASLTGDTTGSGLKRLPRTLALHRPAIVIIELGGNDGLRGIPIKVMRDNLAEMIELSRAAGAEVILAGMQIPTNYGSSYTASLHGCLSGAGKAVPGRSGRVLPRACRAGSRPDPARRHTSRLPQPSRCCSTTSGRCWRRNSGSRRRLLRDSLLDGCGGGIAPAPFFPGLPVSE